MREEYFSEKEVKEMTAEVKAEHSWYKADIILSGVELADNPTTEDIVPVGKVKHYYGSGLPWGEKEIVVGGEEGKTVVLTNLKGAEIKTEGDVKVLKEGKATKIELYDNGSKVVILPKAESGAGSFEVTHWPEWKKSNTK